jgi:hypothetical protein
MLLKGCIGEDDDEVSERSCVTEVVGQWVLGVEQRSE